MNFIDVILRLVPFTHSNEKRETVFLNGLDAGDWIITTFIIVLVGAFLTYIVKLRISYGQDREMIGQLKDALENFKGKMNSGYDDFINSLTQSNGEKNAQANELVVLWQEFDESLIKTVNPLTGEIERRNSIDAEYFFNKHSLLTRLGTKFYAAVPSFLLSIGLIGTFVGLFYGLVQLNMENEETLAESMKVLIHAAGVKFASSIWGLALSLTFTYSEKKWESNLERDIERIQLLVNTAFTRKTAEQSLSVIETQSQIQIDAINGLSLSIAEALGPKISEALVETMAKPLQNLAENIGGSPENTLYQRLDALSGGIGEGFGETMRQLFSQITKEISQKVGADAEQLKNTLTGLTVTLTNLQVSLSQQNEHIQQALGGLVAQVGKQSHVVAQQNESMGASVHMLTEQLQQVNEIINSAKTNLTPIPGYLLSFSDSTEHLKQSAEKTLSASDVLAQSTQFLSKYEAVLTASSAELVSALSDQKIHLNDIAINTVKADQDAQQKYEILAQSYNEMLESNSNNIEQFTQNVKDYKEQVSIGVSNHQEQSKKMNDLMEQTNKNLAPLSEHIRSFTDSAINLKQSAENTLAASNELGQSTRGLKAFEVSLAGAVGGFTMALGQHGTQLQSISSDTEAVSKNAQITYQTLANSYSELLDKNKKNMEQFSQSVKDYQQQADANINKTLAEFDGSLSRFATGLSGAIGELNEAVETLAERSPLGQ